MQTQPSFSKMVELLLPIWQKVLERSTIKLDDNFFELGGNTELAEQLFAEIAKVHGHEFPAVSIYHMLTPATMASVLEESNKPQFEPPVLMKAGSQAPPIFLAHGIGANILDFSDLVNHIQTQRPIYAIQSRGIYGLNSAHQSVEEMAKYHLEAVKKTQSSGPYILVGYSLGGLIMLEVAQRLRASGEQVALLVLIDSYPYRSFLQFGQKVKLYSQLCVRKIKKVIGLSTSSITDSKVSRGTKISDHLLRAREAEKEGAYSALKRYRPSFYDGAIKFIKAEVVTDFPADATAVWKPFVKKLEVDTMKGNHIEMIQTNSALLAELLSRYINQMNFVSD